MTTYREQLKNSDWLEDVENNYIWHKALTVEPPLNDDRIESLSFNDLLNQRFDDGYGGVEGADFVLITTEWVYFPICYDGAEWIGRVPRIPNETFKPGHFGGG